MSGPNCGVAFALGDADTLDEDARKAFALCEPDFVIAANNAGIHWRGRLDAWATLHPTPCQNWVGIVAALKQRLEEGRNRPAIWGHRITAGIDYATQDWGGSTGLLACKVALEKGYSKIIAVGMPLTPTSYFYTHARWHEAARYRRAWEKRKDLLARHVRSMSGWTAELLGSPTREWLDEPTQEYTDVP